MKDRIQQLMEAQHMNQQTFASYTGIGTASLSSIFTGRTRPTLNHVNAILDKFPNINPLWLLKGEGGMLLTTDGSGSDNGSATVSGNDMAQSSPVSTTIGTQDDETYDSPTTQYHKNPKTGRERISANMTDTPNLFSSPHTANPSGNRVPKPDNPQLSGFHCEPQPKIIQIQRKITEIRVFYDDQTWESFVPKK